MKFSTEPAIWSGIAVAGLALLMAFGVPITKEQAGVIIAFLAAVFAGIVRQNVVSSARLEDHNISPNTLKKIDPELPTGVPVTPKVPMVLLAIALGSMLGASCAGGNPPAVTKPQAVVQVTGGADVAIKAADVALTTIEALTPNPIPRKTTLAIAKATEGIGHGGQSLAMVLDAYVKSRGTDDWTKVQGAIAGINKALDAALADVPEPTRTQIRGILQPVTAALLAILTNTPPPGSQAASFRGWEPRGASGFVECNGSTHGGPCDRARLQAALAAQ